MNDAEFTAMKNYATNLMWKYVKAAFLVGYTAGSICGATMVLAWLGKL